MNQKIKKSSLYFFQSLVDQPELLTKKFDAIVSIFPEQTNQLLGIFPATGMDYKNWNVTLYLKGHGDGKLL